MSTSHRGNYNLSTRHSPQGPRTKEIGRDECKGHAALFLPTKGEREPRRRRHTCGFFPYARHYSANPPLTNDGFLAISSRGTEAASWIDACSFAVTPLALAPVLF